MAKIHKARVPLYPVEFYYCSDAASMDKRFDLIHEGAEFSGYCWCPKSAPYVAVHLPHDNGSVVITSLVHESLHAAMYIADIAGLNPTTRSNECVAYLASWVSGKILDFVTQETKGARRPM